MKLLNEELNESFLAQLETFNIEMTKKMHSISNSGVRKSNAKGSSLEFSDFRNYSTGDDLRRIDWNGYARFDRLYMKLFMEEKQASINIFIDTSASMAHDEEKEFCQKMIAVSIAYLALKNTDRVNIYAGGEKINERKTGIQTKNMFYNTVKFIDELNYEGNTMLSKSGLETAKSNMQSGISIVLSDFFSADGYQDLVKSLQRKYQDIVLVQILAESEIEPNMKGNIRLLDSETNEYKDVEMSNAIVKEYKKALSSFKNELREFSYLRGVKFVEVNASEPILKAIKEVL